MVHEWKVLTLHDRYKITRTSVLGEGATAIVYKGLDVQECRNVAVKLFKFDEEDPAAQKDATLEEFRKCLTVMRCLGAADPQRIHIRKTRTESYDAETLNHELAAGLRASVVSSYSSTSASSESVANPILDEIDTTSCYVRLLDHSRTSTGWPGLDEHERVLFLVLELGEESLHQRLQNYRACGQTLSVKELRELQWALASIVWGLHAVGFVHVDIKPANIMRFRAGDRDQWKLIDLDGAVETGVDVRPEQCTFTPEYMPPELAKVLMTSAENPHVTVTMSRLMDVWSIGMCSLEAIFLQPVLRPWFVEWADETGSNKKFFDWLADYGTEPILFGDTRCPLADARSLA